MENGLERNRWEAAGPISRLVQYSRENMKRASARPVALGMDKRGNRKLNWKQK